MSLSHESMIRCFDSVYLLHVVSQCIGRWIDPTRFRPLFEPFQELVAASAGTTACELQLRQSSEFRSAVESWFPTAVRRDVTFWALLWTELHNSADAFKPLRTAASSRATPEFIGSAAHRNLNAIVCAGGSVVLVTDHRFPRLLRHIGDYPLALTILGDPAQLAGRAVACVGSRAASARALAGSVAVGRAFAGHKCNVVSGGAFGCDIAVHRGLLSIPGSGSQIVIVFAGGLSSLYPRGNARWFAEIFAGGGVFVSERLWWAPAHMRDFPVRNRIVAGMADTTVVLEAAERSGALVTARIALDQGRDVLVYRPVERDDRMLGGAKLVDDGATQFDSDAELMELLELHPPVNAAQSAEA